jgi:hypothetical protein
LLDDDVTVGAAESERADAGDDRAIADRQRRRLRLDREAQRAEVDVRVGTLEVQVARDQTAAQRERDLDQTRNAGGRFEVADVRFQRADA